MIVLKLKSFLPYRFLPLDFFCSSLAVVLENIGSVVSLECATTLGGVTTIIGATPSVSLELSVVS